MAGTVQEVTEKKHPQGLVLEESVSFGRFAADSLSWDRWSTFSQNKYMEEVEKCSTPGSVAKKKAYFEAHYRRIYNQKTELWEQEKQVEADNLKTQELHCGNAAITANGLELTGPELALLNVESVTDNVDPETNSTSMVHDAHIESKEDAVATNCQELLNDQTHVEPDSSRESLESDKSEVKEEKHITEYEATIEPEQQFNAETNGNQVCKPEDVGNETPNKSSKKILQKKMPVPKDMKVARTNKTPAVTKPKLPQVSIPKTSEPARCSTIVSASKTSARKERFSLPKSENHSATERKRSTPSSLHMSLSLGAVAANSDPITRSRRSLIMEKMGDKEIVKRAFKTFQNSFNLLTSSTEEEPNNPQKVPVKEKEQHAAVCVTPAKDKNGMRKSVEKGNPQGRQVGTSGTSVYTGPSEASRGSKTIAKPASSFSSRGNERSETRREFSLKSEEKSNAKEVEKVCLTTKSRVNNYKIGQKTGTGRRLESHQKHEKAPQAGSTEVRRFHEHNDQAWVL